jgi:hypothetical protein
MTSRFFNGQQYPGVISVSLSNFTYTTSLISFDYYIEGITINSDYPMVIRLMQGESLVDYIDSIENLGNVGVSGNPFFTTGANYTIVFIMDDGEISDSAYTEFIMPMDLRSRT